MIQRSAAIAFAVLAVLAGRTVAHAYTIEQRASLGTLWYEKFENEEKAGWLSIRFAKADADGNPALQTDAATEIRVPQPQGTLRYSSEDRSYFDADMHLTSFHSKIRVNDKPIDLEGKRTETGYSIVVHQEDKEQTLAFDKKDYDYTSADEVYDQLQKTGQELRFRVLDFESLAVVPVVYRLEREEDCRHGGRKTTCEVYYYQKGQDVSNAWVTKDDGVLVRQRGVSREGSYEIRLSGEVAARKMPAAPAARKKPTKPATGKK